MNLGLLTAPWSADPDRNASIDQAMWALSAGLLSGAGSGRNFAANLGNAMTGATSAYNASQQDALRRKAIQSQLDEQMAQADERKRRREQERMLSDIARASIVPGRPESPGSLGGGVTPGSQHGMGLMGAMTRSAAPEDQAFDAALLASDNAVLNEAAMRQGASVSGVAPPMAATPPSFDTERFMTGLMGAGMPLEALRMRKELMSDIKPVVVGDALVDPATGRVVYQQGAKPMNVAPGGSVVDPATGRVVYQAPDRQQAPTEIEKLISARNQFPVGSPERRLVEQRIEALNYRQPPASMNVSYGAPFVGVDPQTGQPMLYQPNNRGGAPQPTGLAPPPKEAQPAPERFNTAIAGINELNAALSNYEKVLKEVGGPNMLARGENRAKLQGAYTAMQMGLKNAMELGALTGPDEQILGNMLKDPTSIMAGTVLGEEGVRAQINEARSYLRGRERAITETYKRPNPASTQQQQQAPQSFQMLPNAAEHAGVTMRDRVSGKRYRSDGNKWTEVQ